MGGFSTLRYRINGGLRFAKPALRHNLEIAASTSSPRNDRIDHPHPSPLPSRAREHVKEVQEMGSCRGWTGVSPVFYLPP